MKTCHVNYHDDSTGCVRIRSQMKNTENNLADVNLTSSNERVLARPDEESDSSGYENPANANDAETSQNSTNYQQEICRIDFRPYLGPTIDEPLLNSVEFLLTCLQILKDKLIRYLVHNTIEASRDNQENVSENKNCCTNCSCSQKFKNS